MRVSFLTCALVAVACGDPAPRTRLTSVDAGLTATDGAPMLDSGVDAPRWRPEEDAERLAIAECAWRRRCAPSVIARWDWSRDQDCRLALRALRSEALTRRGQLVADGRARFDRVAFEACLDAYESGRCGAIDCPDFFLGVAPLDAACSDSDECAEGYCTGEPLASCGRCARKKSGFEACAIDAECQSARCQQRCLPPVAVGDRCDKLCTFGLCCPGSCVGPGLGTGTCRALAGRWEACDPTESAAPRCDAELGLICRGGACAPIDVVGAGVPCGDEAWCADGRSCLAGACLDWPRSGEPCAGRCRGDDVCKNGHCQQAPAEGEPCVLDDQCGPDLVCRGEGQRVCCSRRELDCR